MKKIFLIVSSFLIISCNKKINDDLIENLIEKSDTIDNSENEIFDFTKVKFMDRAEELIYIREYLKYKLPKILVKKYPEEIKKVQYELISNGENPSLEESAKKSLFFYNYYESYMPLIISEKLSFVNIKEQLETNGDINFDIKPPSFNYNSSDNINEKEFEVKNNKDEKPKASKNSDDSLSDILNGNNSNSNGTGSGTGSKSEPLFGNRRTIYKPQPEYNCNEEGVVAVQITVDKNGNTLNAIPGVSGSTNTARCLLDACKEAALKTKWEAVENAPEKQTGKIVYNFRLSN